MKQAEERPESFSIRERDNRRVNLQRFPYHFLFRIVGDVVRILVVRHHSRRPTVGVRRQ
jgi:toxin ParE1/3/4